MSKNRVNMKQYIDIQPKPFPSHRCLISNGFIIHSQTKIIKHHQESQTYLVNTKTSTEVAPGTLQRSKDFLQLGPA